MPCRGKIKNRQASVSKRQADVDVRPDALSVRTSVHHAVGHRLRDLHKAIGVHTCLHETCQTTHVDSLTPQLQITEKRQKSWHLYLQRVPLLNPFPSCAAHLIPKRWIVDKLP